MLEQYYLTIRKQLPNVMEGEEVEVTLPQLTEWLHFSSRNVNLVLKKMEEESWIRWLPGRGRGHRSKIVFRITRESVAMRLAQDYVGKGDLQLAFAWIDEHAYLPALRDQFVLWLDRHFGYRPEETEEDRTDTLRIPYNKPIQCLDPPYITFVVESHMAKQLFDNLVRYNKHTKTIEPQLAHHWCRNEAGTEWIFYLRKGVLFHHGREMTSHDVKFTLDRICRDAGDSPYYWMFEDVERVEVINRYTVRIELARPNSLFLNCLSFDRASIVPEDLVQSMGELFKRTPVGTGPFQITQHDNNMLVCEAFTRYFDKRAHLDRIEIWFTPELNCKSSWVERTVHRIRTPDSEETMEQTNHVEILSNGCSKMLTFNLKMEGPQQRLAFRQALIHGVDRKRLELLTSPLESMLADWFVPKEHGAAAQEELYDPEHAKQLLKDSGYHGETLLLAINEASAEDGKALQKLLGEMGIRIQLEITGEDPAERMMQVERSHICWYNITMDDDLILSILEVFLAGNSFVNVHLNDEFMTEMKPIIRQIYTADSIHGPSGQLAGIEQLERLVKKHAAVFFLYHCQQKTTYHPSLKGVTLNALGWLPFGEVWFEPVVKPSGLEAK
ncbi:ABC transporter substrate-binding protein [Paenibacillus sp. NPDC056579]|uniref:ABC transporter substrate-binding protein n=1 Tax=Paenibacillus sp. NPDC056579 TaxID=3345871 RepID=UPI0036B0AD7F